MFTPLLGGHPEKPLAFLLTATERSVRRAFYIGWCQMFGFKKVKKVFLKSKRSKKMFGFKKGKGEFPHFPLTQ